MPSPPDLAVGSVLLIWMILCVVRQFSPSLARLTKRRDYLGLIPGWKLFSAPSVGRHYCIWFRDMDVNGDLSDWERWDPALSRNAWIWLWNPDKRAAKWLANNAQALLSGTILIEANATCLPQREFHRFVQQFPWAQSAAMRQFGLGCSDPFDACSVPTFISDFRFLPPTNPL